MCEELPLQGTSEVACGPGRGEGEPSRVSWRVDERGLSSAGLLGEQALLLFPAVCDCMALEPRSPAENWDPRVLTVPTMGEVGVRGLLCGDHHSSNRGRLPFLSDGPSSKS